MMKRIRSYLLILPAILWGCSNDELKDIVDRINQEVAIIDQYIADNGLTAIAHPSGLRIVYTQSNGEPPPNGGQTVSMDYTGFLLDANGTIFDSSLRHVAEDNNVLIPNKQYIPEEFVIGNGSTPIKGWEIGVLLMGQGDRATILLPSGIAYGSAGFGDLVPSNTVVGFDIHLLEIRN